MGLLYIKYRSFCIDTHILFNSMGSWYMNLSDYIMGGRCLWKFNSIFHGWSGKKKVPPPPPPPPGIFFFNSPYKNGSKNRVLTNSKFGLFYSNFLILTPTFSKVPIEKYGKTPIFSGKQHFYSYFQNPSENSEK